MSIQFNETTYSKKTVPKEKSSGIVASMIRMGIVKNTKYANFVLIGLIALLISGTFFLLYMNNNTLTVLDSTIDPKTYLPYGVEPPQ